MADPNGQRGIKNTLLSAATGSNFFEEAAMLVPVPIVESQEPAIAEIDLNSDDSSSNRGSIEKELPEQSAATSSVEESYNDPFDDSGKPPPISLFSRAASTGVDVFSRMLAGTSASKEEAANTGVGSTAPAVSREFVGRSTIEVDPNIVGMNPVSGPFTPVDGPGVFTSPAAYELFANRSLDNQSIPSRFISSTADPTTLAEYNTFGTTSSIFTDFGSSPQLFPETVGSNVTETSSTPNVLPPAFNLAMQSNSDPMLPPTSAPMAPSHFQPAPLASATTQTSSTLFPSNNNSGDSLSTQPPPMCSASITSTAPGIARTASLPPPVASGGSNSFRLGAQRMKYVPCQEIKSAPIAAAPLPPVQGFPPPVDPHNVMGMAPGIPRPPIVFMDSSQASLSSVSQSPTVASLFNNGFGASDMASRSTLGIAYSQSATGLAYDPQELSPLTYHWFYRKDLDGKVVWKPFSLIDSVALEDALANNPAILVPTDGGRYDVSVMRRLKLPVYWEEAPIEVRRGSWFFKGPMDNRFIPYEEDFAERLEREYGDCMKTGIWQKRLEFPENETVIMHSTGVVVHFCQAAAPDDWGNLPESQIRPRVVKRGIEEIEVEDGESTQVDHLVFVVHGIGPICDFKLRNIVEAVDDFRSLSFQLLNSHYKESMDKNLVGRVEFLPVSWHKALHGDKGIDDQLKRITLRSIPKFRDFTNDTLLDILFYTSPVYCQTIIDSVGSELNRIYKMFLNRNSSFKGKVSLTGHSLGSLILFDLLAHQPLNSTTTEKEVGAQEEENKVLSTEAKDVKDENSSARTISYTIGNAGTGQPFITYPRLDFSPSAFFALGSPIAMFVTIRGIENLGNDFRLPTCPAFFNIFHPFDPVAYRIETLIEPNFQSRPVLIPHHKGRKRIHLELKETMSRMGSDIKHRVMDAVNNTLKTVYHYTGLNKGQDNLDNEIHSAIATEMEKKAEADGAENENSHIVIGSLNGGRRIDYVLQETPYEVFNEYVFAMSTHVGYWESEDTMLLLLNEVYENMGINKDTQVAQGAVSPTHSQPSIHHATSLASYPGASYDVNAHSAQSVPSLFQASAPVFKEYQNQSGYQPHQPSAYTPATYPSMPSPPSVSVPLIQPTNHVGGVLLPPNPMSAATSTSMPTVTKPAVIGNRPVADPGYFPQGMDPTAPMLSMSQVGPPPKIGFVRK